MKLFENTDGNSFKLMEEFRCSSPIKSHIQIQEEIKNLMEMPIRIPKWENNKLESSDYNHGIVAYYKENGKLVDAFKNYDIYELIDSDKINNIFVNGEIAWAYFKFKVDKNIMFEDTVWQDMKSGGLCREILFNYYLKRYNGIISDGKHSPYGEKYWKKLLQQAKDSGYKLFAVDIGTWTPTSIGMDDIDKFYSNTLAMEDYRFMILK